jgi:hypothetical protein
MPFHAIPVRLRQFKLPPGMAVERGLLRPPKATWPRGVRKSPPVFVVFCPANSGDFANPMCCTKNRRLLYRTQMIILAAERRRWTPALLKKIG